MGGQWWGRVQGAGCRAERERRCEWNALAALPIPPELCSQMGERIGATTAFGIADSQRSVSLTRRSLSKESNDTTAVVASPAKEERVEAPPSPASDVQG